MGSYKGLRTTDVSVPMAHKNGLLGQSGSGLTFDQAADSLLAIRMQLSSMWPEVRKRAAAMTDTERVAWNAAAYSLIDLELKLYNDLKRAGVQNLPDPSKLQQTLQVGRFAGVGNGQLGALPVLGLAGWLAVALGASLASSGLLYFGAMFVESFSRADILRSESLAGAIKVCLETGKCTPEQVRDIFGQAGELAKHSSSSLVSNLTTLLVVGAVIGAGYWYFIRPSRAAA